MPKLPSLGRINKIRSLPVFQATGITGLPGGLEKLKNGVISLNMDFSERVRRQFLEGAELHKTVAMNWSDHIVQMVDGLISSLRKGGKILFCGNGGSAADSQHLSTELVSRLHLNRPPIPALALTTNTSFLTAHSNDFGFDDIFARQIEALGSDKDTLIGFSTNGNSENVIRAFQSANRKRMFCIGFTGKDGGKFPTHTDICLIVPSDNTARIQEIHITAGHILCDLIEEELFRAYK